MSPAVERVRAALEVHGYRPRVEGDRIKFRCPVHDDTHASASLSEGDDGRAVLFCHANHGCTCEAIVERIGLKMGDLFADAPKTERRIVATYDYHDERGELLYQVVRFDPKDFRQRRPDGRGGWVWNMAGVRRVLYGLPNVIEAAKHGETVYLTEGEKDASAINAVDGSGFVATTHPGGAGKWRPEYGDTLTGANVVLIADNDEPGRRHALDVAADLKGKAASVRIVQAKTGKDAADHLAAGHGLGFVPFVEPGEDPKPADDLPRPLSLYGDTFTPRRPEFDTPLSRRAGLLHIWSAPGGLKTHTVLTFCHEMLCDSGRGRLFGHPGLWINRRWKRALWITVEECGDELRYQAEEILKGLGKDKLDGELCYVFAASNRRVTLDDLSKYIDRDGPWDAIVLDHMTGLRPKVVNGERVKWDVDNDLSDEQCIRLRGLADTHKLLFVMINHSGRDTTRYRGATAWWQSADTQIGLSSDGGKVKVDVEKVRGGKKPAPFVLEPGWNADGSFTLTYSGAAIPSKLPPTAKAMAAFLKAKGAASQTEMIEGVGCARSTGSEAVKALVDAGIAVPTGETKAKSPVYRYQEPTADEVSGPETGHMEDDND